MTKFKEYLEAAQEGAKVDKLNIGGKFLEAVYIALGNAKPSDYPDKNGSIGKATQDLKECGVVLVFDSEGDPNEPDWNKFKGHSNFYEYHDYDGLFMAIATKKPINFKAKGLKKSSIEAIKNVVEDF